MPTGDLSKLRIDRNTAQHNWSGRRRLLLATIAGLLFLAWVLRMLFAPAIAVETLVVSHAYPSQTYSLLNASGYVVAQRKAAVAAKSTGRLVWLGVEEGSRVQAGTVLARLESADVQATRSQAVANLENARTGVEQAEAELHDAELAHGRLKSLLAEGIIAQAEFDTAEARLRKARAAQSGARSGVAAASATLRGANVALEYTMIRAPFTGVVLTKNADLGDIVTPLGAAANAKSAVVTMADMESLQVEADVSESSLEQVHGGQPCEILLDALPGVRLRGQVHMIVPTADRAKASVMVKIRFLDRDPRILPEMSAKVSFLSRQVTRDEQRPRVAILPSAVLHRNGEQTVFVLRGDRVVQRAIHLGQRVGDLVEVSSGLQAGDKIVLAPLQRLRDGSRVSAAEK